MQKSLWIDVRSPINWQNSLNAGLVSRWKNLPGGQWGRGTKWRDLALKSGKDGTLTNGPTWAGAMGRPGGSGSLGFNGSNQYGSVSGFRLGTNNITIAAWAWSTTFDYSGKMLVNSQPTNSGYAIRLEASKVRFHGDSAGSVVEFSPPTGGMWHHFVGTLNGTSAAIYCDGVQQATGTITGITDSSRTLDFAAYTDFGGGYYFPGNLDDICILNRAWSASEVAAFYQSNKRPDDPTLNWIDLDALDATAAAPGGDTASRARYMPLMGAA